MADKTRTDSLSTMGTVLDFRTGKPITTLHTRRDDAAVDDMPLQPAPGFDTVTDDELLAAYEATLDRGPDALVTDNTNADRLAIQREMANRGLGVPMTRQRR